MQDLNRQWLGASVLVAMSVLTLVPFVIMFLTALRPAGHSCPRSHRIHSPPCQAHIAWSPPAQVSTTDQRLQQQTLGELHPPAPGAIARDLHAPLRAAHPPPHSPAPQPFPFTESAPESKGDPWVGTHE